MPVTQSIGAQVLCGVDGTPEGVEAACQAGRLVDPDGSLTLVASFDTGAAAETGYLAARTAAELKREARAALNDAAAAVGMTADTRLLDAQPHAALEAEAARLNATLVVLGTHELSRGLGILLGSVATESVHMPGRPTLIARDSGAAPERFPRSIAVGEDGSPSSKHARTVASGLAERFDVPYRRILCMDGDPDLEAAREVAGPIEIFHGRAHHELVQISEEVDLLVVGAAGRRGLRALGSVSERVAHKAKCSVLVVPLPPTETQ